MIDPSRYDARSPGSRGPDRFSDGRQLSQSSSDRRGHMVKLPTDLLADGLRSVRTSQAGGLRGIRGGTESVRAHVRGARGLPGRSGGGRRYGRCHVDF